MAKERHLRNYMILYDHLGKLSYFTNLKMLRLGMIPPNHDFQGFQWTGFGDEIYPADQWDLPDSMDPHLTGTEMGCWIPKKKSWFFNVLIAPTTNKKKAWFFSNKLLRCKECRDHPNLSKKNGKDRSHELPITELSLSPLKHHWPSSTVIDHRQSHNQNQCLITLGS